MKRLAAFIVALGIAGVAGAFIVARPVDARLVACGASTVNSVDLTFNIPAANRIWDYVPSLQKSPELTTDGRPAFVALFRGTFTSPFAGTIREGGGERAAKTYENVMCVVQADGTVNLYADVPRDGLVTPGS